VSGWVSGWVGECESEWVNVWVSGGWVGECVSEWVGECVSVLLTIIRTKIQLTSLGCCLCTKTVPLRITVKYHLHFTSWSISKPHISSAGSNSVLRAPLFRASGHTPSEGKWNAFSQQSKNLANLTDEPNLTSPKLTERYWTIIKS
jgi:hypothetical protein